MAEQNLLNVTVSKVDAHVFDGQVVSVHVPGIDGEMEILANHEALISPLKAGVVTIKKTDGTQETHEITSGILEISDNYATILI